MGDVLDIRARFDAALPSNARWNVREATLLRLAEDQAATITELEKTLAAEGWLTTGSMGQVRVHPLVAEIRLQRAALARTLEGIRLPSESQEKSVKHQRAVNRRWDRRDE